LRYEKFYNRFLKSASSYGLDPALHAFDTFTDIVALVTENDEALAHRDICLEYLKIFESMLPAAYAIMRKYNAVKGYHEDFAEFFDQLAGRADQFSKDTQEAVNCCVTIINRHSGMPPIMPPFLAHNEPERRLINFGNGRVMTYKKAFDLDHPVIQ
jgi:hypothetical protein